MQALTSNRTTGLIGLFGHAYAPDPERPDSKTIHYQFDVIRMSGDRWVVQLFSFWDGQASELRVYDESFLLGEDVKLSGGEDAWHRAQEKELGTASLSFSNNGAAIVRPTADVVSMVACIMIFLPHWDRKNLALGKCN